MLEQCQLRCNYCEPGAFSLAAKKSWLSVSQYEKIARALARFSFKKIRFTGGEPLLRPDLPFIIEQFSKAMPQALLAITTNGQRFLATAPHLVEKGLHTITFHVDSLIDDRYQTLMGKGELKKALLALEFAQSLGLKVKINCVVQRGLNDDELIAFLKFSQSSGIPVRFIELMDTGSAREFVRKHFMSGRDIIKSLEPLGVIPVEREHPSDPARLFFASLLGVTFGLIASDTEPFCSDCDRIRLSANGRLYTCLYEPGGEALILGAEEELLHAQIERKIGAKESWHPSIPKPRRLFSMSQTGG